MPDAKGMRLRSGNITCGPALLISMVVGEQYCRADSPLRFVSSSNHSHERSFPFWLVCAGDWLRLGCLYWGGCQRSSVWIVSATGGLPTDKRGRGIAAKLDVSPQHVLA